MLVFALKLPPVKFSFCYFNLSCYGQDFEMADTAFYEKNKAFPLIFMFSVIHRG